MGLRAVYIDLDGTLLGRDGALVFDGDGTFSKAPIRMLEACHRAGVEVVLTSGRREGGVAPVARLLGQNSYIFEVGCGVMIGDELTVLDGGIDCGGDTISNWLAKVGVPELLFELAEGRLESATPWDQGRRFSLLLRGLVDLEAGNRALREAGHENLRLLDNGRITHPMANVAAPRAYHVVPATASKANAVAAHRRARAYSASETIAIGDSVEDLEMASAVGHFFCVANGAVKDPGVRARIGSFPNATVTEGERGEGCYEAVVATLAGAVALG